VTRNDDLGYPIYVGAGVVLMLRLFVRKHNYRRVVVLCDRNVARFAARVARITGAQAPLEFALGERRKTLRTVGTVLEALAAAKVDRTTLVVSVGGGVASDLFGFAGAVYMRGVPFASVPTTLLAMVDAAIGGKTGVDLAAGKNLAGAFRDPVAVFCDLDVLSGLPERQWREGLAEVVKHGIIEGDEVFASLERLAPHALRRWPMEAVVAESVRVKAMFVAEDRLERGARETLNLGHTVAHGIEAASGYRLSHGSAVAVGLRAAGMLALRTGRFSRDEHLRVLSLLALLRLPLFAPGIDPDAIRAAMGSDKKARGGRLRFVLPNKIGDVERGVEVPPATLRAVLRRLGEPPGNDEGAPRKKR